MKYKNFNEWYDDDPRHKRRGLGQYIKSLMLDAWDAAVNNNPFDGAKEIVKLNILRKQAAIGVKITELLTTLNDIEKIDCTCDKKQIASGRICACQRGMANQQAGIALGTYLRKLRGELKYDVKEIELDKLKIIED